MELILVNTQEELDLIPIDFNGQINIIGSINHINTLYPKAVINVYGNAQITSVYGYAKITRVYGNAKITRVYDNAQISSVYDNAQITRVSDNAQINYVYNNAQITSVSENAQITRVSENAQITRVSDNAQITYVYDTAQITRVYGNAQITYVYNNAQITRVYGNAQITRVYGNAQITSVFGDAHITRVYDNAQITHVFDNAQITRVYDNAQITSVYGYASILNCSGYATIETLGQNIISYNKKETNLTIKASPKTTIVILEDINPTFDSYQTLYPVKINNDHAILYKAVRLINHRLVSDYDRSFEYKIGERIHHECNPSIHLACAFGLHVSHKMWALNFGMDWDDMILIECEVPINKIIVPKDCDGKVRTSELKVLRIVPKEEYYL